MALFKTAFDIRVGAGKAPAATNSAKDLLRRVGIGTAIGAGLGGYAGHSQAKFQKVKKKQHRNHIIGGAILGGIGGGALGGQHHVRMAESELGEYSKSKLKNLAHYAKKHGLKGTGDHHPLIGTAIGGGLGGAYGYGTQVLENKQEKKKKNRVSPVATGILSAGIGAVGGYQIGKLTQDMRRSGITHHKWMRTHERSFKRDRTKWDKQRQTWEAGRQQARQERRSWGGHRPPGGEARSAPKPSFAEPPDWLKGVTTKAEAKKKFRDMAYKHHPDRGGSTEKMQDLNSQWEKFKTHHFDKLAHRRMISFADEIMKIAGAE